LELAGTLPGSAEGAQEIAVAAEQADLIGLAIEHVDSARRISVEITDKAECALRLLVVIAAFDVSAQ
jgi:hypothetical protein